MSSARQLFLCERLMARFDYALIAAVLTRLRVSYVPNAAYPSRIVNVGLPIMAQTGASLFVLSYGMFGCFWIGVLGYDVWYNKLKFYPLTCNMWWSRCVVMMCRWKERDGGGGGVSKITSKELVRGFLCIMRWVVMFEWDTNVDFHCDSQVWSKCLVFALQSNVLFYNMDSFMRKSLVSSTQG
jgi:hypothetical protein